MPRPLPLATQNAYIDLLARLQDAQVAQLARDPGNFTVKEIKGRRYWYRQYAAPDGKRSQVSVGPETPELLGRIEQHRNLVGAERERRDLVRSMTRSGMVARVPSQVGEVVEALAGAGVFRLRAVLVGTVAFSTYGAMLGFRFGEAGLATEDVDVAQVRSTSIAVEDTIAADMLTLLRSVDKNFVTVTAAGHDAAPISYKSGRLKVEFLTPMRGKARSAPVKLAALDTSAQALRFLDYLIYKERPAALLYGPGILVNVPDPARYAWHKVIVSGRRVVDPQKRVKDLLQAEMLFDALTSTSEGRGDLRDMWDELAGPERVNWQAEILGRMGEIRAELRERVLQAIS